MVDSAPGIEPNALKGMRFYIVSITLLAITAIAGIWGIVAFVDSEKERDLLVWQSRLSIVAEARQAAVTDWIERQFETVRRLAENESLQLYMTEITLARTEGRPASDAEAETGYLRNLLVVTAEQTGFVPAVKIAAVEANVQRAGGAGIALVDATGQLIVSSPYMPPSSPEIREAIGRAASGQRVLIDIHVGVSNEPMIGFVTPVYGIQETPGVDPHLGLIVAVRPLSDEFFATLTQPGVTERTAETYLVRERDGSVEYLTPLADGTPPLRRSLDAATPDLASAYAAGHPGGFAAKTNYDGRTVLVTGRKIPGTEWTLVRTVSETESLAEINRRADMMLAVLLSIAAGLIVVVIAVWRHGSSVRAARAAEAHRTLSERLENVLKFLRLVTDSQPAAILVADEKDKVVFSNMTTAAWAGADHPKTLMGKSLANVLGPVKAKALSTINREVFLSLNSASRMLSFADESGNTMIKTEHIFVRGDAWYPPSVLMVLEDVTELNRERVRRESALRQLVQTLVSAVDRRDPYSADHSRRVNEVTIEIAQEMGLPRDEVETVAIASSLMNLGKILVPTELLTKREGLTEEERRVVGEAIVAGSDFIEGVEFNGPVLQTVRDIHRLLYPDIVDTGTGDVAVGAHVVGVANAFVGMTSNRSWRRGMPIKEACNRLLAEAETRFDERPIAALLNYVNNRGGEARWAYFGEAGEA